MREIGDRIILWLFCLILVVYVCGISTVVVVGTLLAFTISCLGVYVEGKGIRLLFILAYTILSVYMIEFLLFIPVIIYEWLNVVWAYRKSRFLKLSENGSFSQDNAFEKNIIICVLPAFVLLISVVNNISRFHNSNMIFWAAIAIIAIWLNVYCNIYADLKQKFIINRDNSAELTIALKNKNKYLIEKQDNEIYLATLRERNRIAREIHDNVGHMLTRSILQMGAVLTINKDKELQPLLNGIKETLDLAMTSIRTSVHDLHDEAIDLNEAVKEITAKDLKNYEVTIDFDMSNDVPRSIKYCFISVIKETASNIIRHSNADAVIISLREHPAFYRLSVEDNGTVCEKMNKLDIDSDGIGLSNIKERVESFNGTLNINTDKGFQIVISIPKKLGA